MPIIVKITRCMSQLYRPTLISFSGTHCIHSSQCRHGCRGLRLTITKVFIPAKAFARDYGITGVRLSVCLFVCLFVCYHDNEIKRGRIWTKFFGKVPRGKASPSSFAVTIASWVWRLLSKNAVNRSFFSNVNKPISNVNKPTHNK